MSASGNWRVDENGLLVVKEVRAKKGTFEEKLEVGSSEQPAGVTVYDEDTKNPYCIKVKSGISVTVSGPCSSVNQNDETVSSTQE